MLESEQICVRDVYLLNRCFQIRCVQLAYTRVSAVIFDLECNIKATNHKTQSDLPAQGNEPFYETNNYTYKIN